MKEPRLGMASDWVSSIGGSSTGVYLLYGHPDCEWEHTRSTHVISLDAPQPTSKARASTHPTS
eukprot:4030943-Prorocentrum_lima.AAC.1